MTQWTVTEAELGLLIELAVRCLWVSCLRHFSRHVREAQLRTSVVPPSPSCRLEPRLRLDCLLGSDSDALLLDILSPHSNKRRL